MRITKIVNADDYYYGVFMAISESLTGFSVNELQATGLAETYYNHILSGMETATFTEFLKVSQEVLDRSYSKNQLHDAICAGIVSHPSTQDMAGKVITLWYLGTWDGTYINDRSYKQGLVWNVMHAHPPGAKQPGFRSWSVQPVNSNP